MGIDTADMYVYSDGYPQSLAPSDRHVHSYLITLFEFRMLEPNQSFYISLIFKTFRKRDQVVNEMVA
jgi:hypothetical protein